MSSDASKKPVPPNAELIAEIDALVEEIKAFHAARGRGIAKQMKRGRKGRAALADLEGLGVNVPDTLRALYWNWNGAESKGRMSKWDRAVFFDHQWVPADMLISWQKISKLENQTHNDSGIRLFMGGGTKPFMQWSASPSPVQDAPLVAALPWAQRVYAAFDGILPMLRSVVAAEKAGVISYALARATSDDGTILTEENAIQYDPAALWESIAPLNPLTADAEHNYWRAIATDTLEFDGEPPDISSGKIEMKPEVQEIVFREAIAQKKKWDEKLAKKIRDE